MAREIKYRGLKKDNKEFVFGSLVNVLYAEMLTYCPNIVISYNYDTFDWIEVIPDTIGQYTGENEIYEGDIIQWRFPYRTTQTHAGDNIPNGSYTEPMEPAIRTYTGAVSFENGMFVVNKEDGAHDENIPLFYITQQLWNEENIMDAISYRRDDADFWDDPEEGDLQYLLQENKLADLQSLIDFVSEIKVIGNIYENPELLNTPINQ